MIQKHRTLSAMLELRKLDEEHCSRLVYIKMCEEEADPEWLRRNVAVERVVADAALAKIADFEKRHATSAARIEEAQRHIRALKKRKKLLANRAKIEQLLRLQERLKVEG